MNAYQATGKPERTLVARLRPGTDLMTGLKELAESSGIKAAYIPTIIGGVNEAEIEVATPSAESPVGVVAKHIKLTGPIAIIAAQGMISELEDGTIEPHLHITFVDANGHIHGGHLLPGTAPVTTTADVIMQEVSGVKFGRGYDEDVKTKLFLPTQR
jgi:predicted DNA-binding protein with PD1-like motif